MSGRGRYGKYGELKRLERLKVRKKNLFDKITVKTKRERGAKYKAPRTPGKVAKS